LDAAEGRTEFIFSSDQVIVMPQRVNFLEPTVVDDGRPCESTPLVKEKDDEFGLSIGDSHHNVDLNHYSIVKCREVLTINPEGVRTTMSLRCKTNTTAIEVIDSSGRRNWIISSIGYYYRIWWYSIVVGAILTMFVTPYQIAFQESQSVFKQLVDVLEKLLLLLFVVDILINFNLALYKDDKLILDRRQITTEYLRRPFWIDILGVIPFATIIPWCATKLDASYETTLILSLFRLLHFVRTRRLVKFSDDLRWDARVSLLMYTMIRNLALVLFNCHLQACTFYFLARLYQFDKSTWLGTHLRIIDSSSEELEAYVTAFYMCVTTFATVGYGDYTPRSTVEKIAGSCFMISNIALGAYIIGSITLLVLKNDESSRKYRHSLQVLHQYGTMHHFDDSLMTRLKRQLRLDFNNEEVSDENVLKHFPSQVRRKIMRKLYHGHLLNSNILTGIQSQFIDAFLASCTVEIFSPGEEIIEKGSISSDLYLLVGGIAEIITTNDTSHNDQSLRIEYGVDTDLQPHVIRLEAGMFIGTIGFFTESPQPFRVKSITAVKTLTLSRQSYQILAQDYAGSTGQILQNLMQELESVSVSSNQSTYHQNPTLQLSLKSFPGIIDLMNNHMRRRLDDDITKLLFAASRGDNNTIIRMYEHGLDLNESDYDNRTALMIASMKGNADTVQLLLKYEACTDKIDMNGSTALLEATKYGHDKVQELLLASGAKLCLTDTQAASILCQTVFDGDIKLLNRLVKAGINVNAADYDGRTASHIAEAEGNIAAIRVLVSSGADLTLKDRWGNCVGKDKLVHR